MKLKIMTVLGIYCLISCSKKDTATVPNPTPIQPKLSISGFSPVSGKTGDTITITGTNFGNDHSVVGVTFSNSSKTQPISVSDTKIQVRVPNDAKTGVITVTLKDQYSGTSSDNFTVNAMEPLRINGLSANFAFVGDTIHISGTGFGTDPQKLIVRINPFASVTPISASAAALSFIIPQMPTDQGAVTLRVVRVGVDSTNAYWPISYIFQARPIITDFYPKDVNQGDTITITGKNLNSGNTASIGVWAGSGNSLNERGFRISQSATQIQVIFIPGTEIIKAPIEIRMTGSTGYNDGILYSRVVSKDSLIVRPRTIVYNLLSSASQMIGGVNTPVAKAGEIVTINGVFNLIEYPNMKVRFTGSAIDVVPELSGAINNQIKIKVPSDAKTGSVNVSRPGWAAGTTTNTLTILP